MGSKAGLKAAKAALDAEDWSKAVVEAQKVLASDAQNYFARLFLGRAQEKQKNFDESAKTYLAAAKSKPDDNQAWLGLCSVYEAQGSAKIDEYREAATKVIELYAVADDKHKGSTTIDKLVAFAKKHGTTTQYKRVLELLLPGSPIYDFLEGRIQHPSVTYTRLAEFTEKEEEQQIKQEISQRRTRIGARIGQVTLDVKREVWMESNLEQLYQQIIDWTSDDDVRHQYEERLLERAYSILTVLPLEDKPAKLDRVLNLAEGMVIIKHAFQLAWDIVLETRDLDELRDLDQGIVREYITLFQGSGLAKVLEAWLSSELSPFPSQPKPKDEDVESEAAGTRELNPEDRLLLMTEGLAGAGESPFAHRLVGDYYLHLEEYETAVQTTREGLKVLQDTSTKLGMTLQNTKDAISSVLGTVLVQYQAPRHHVEARRLFDDILERKPKFSPALIGLGLIYEETEHYEDAIGVFTTALDQDPSNILVGTELAWCRALCGDHSRAQQDLEAYLPSLKTDDPRSRDLRAQVLYRIGVCVWQQDASKSARRSRDGAYARFLAAIKTNVNCAPAYTSLGIYYSDYGRDKKRGRQCFQKAFELSTSEIEAAERLAKSFANEGDWDIVEIVAQRVVDSGKARPPPGSRKKGVSWPYSALGVVQMNKQQYQKAIVSFLAALRISPDDYQSYIGLGESYHNSGRYNSALRTFTYALDPPESSHMKITGERWFAQYMLANVHRELGEYDEAVRGLRSVLEERPSEFGVLMSLQQTYVEKAWRCVETGIFGQAVESAQEAIKTACTIVKDRPQAFNMWKGVGDACMVYTSVQSGLDSFPLDDVQALLETDLGKVEDVMTDIDQVKIDAVRQDAKLPALAAGILALKKAVQSSAHDIHAQAVAWYNLGWSELRGYICSDSKEGKKFLRAAVRCFKRAIELEAGNAEFWNALGIVTTTLNPKVAQHAFVRSLHLNELNAKVWANLGVLYFLQNDYQLAHQAFGRAQSTDPDYAHAWVGEGLLALLEGNKTEALNHFTHAFEISDSASIISKRQYAVSSFDFLLESPSTSNNLTHLIQPSFALSQLQSQVVHDLPYRHLAALFLERVGDYATATAVLTDLCARAETDYEQTESLASLARYALAKSDLARNQFAIQDFPSAIDNAQTALDLTSDPSECGLDDTARNKLRLSAHLTAGLSSHHLNDTTSSISMFKSALQESSFNPDVTCLLVKVLWAHGGTDERSVAKEQLFDCVENHPSHVGAVTLLGAIASLENDTDTIPAVQDDLLHLRTNDSLSRADKDEIDTLLTSFALLGPSLEDDCNALTETQAALLLDPKRPRAWAELASQTGDEYAARMALRTAQQAVPPLGDMGAEELAAAFAGTGTVGDAQRGSMVAPWMKGGWEAMVEGLKAAQ